MSDWYDKIEEEIRPLVKLLRNNGFNTTCSCGHNMWVQGDLQLGVDDINTLHKLIWDYMNENKMKINFEINFIHKVEDGYTIQSYFDIKLIK